MIGEGRGSEYLDSKLPESPFGFPGILL